MARKEKKYAEDLLPLLQDSDPEIRAQAARWLGDMKYKEAAAKIVPLLKDSYSRARFFAAEALGRMEYEPAINPIIDLLRANSDEDAYIRHAGCLALARIGKAAPIISLANDSSRALRIAAVVTLRRMSNAGITHFLNDADEFVVTEAARAINDDLSITDALPALGNLLKTTPFTNEALIRRCINANLRVGTREAMQNLVDYANRADRPAEMKAEAIAALSTWPKPSVVDRVDGRYRGIIQRDANEVRSATGDALTQLLNARDSIVRANAVIAVSKLKITQAAPALMAILKNDKEPSIRAEALKALAHLENPHIDEAIKVAMADKTKMVRVAGIDLIPKLKISKELMASLLSGVINTKTTEERQTALLTLGNLPLQNSQKVLEDLLQKMASKKLSSDVYLELGEAIDSSGSQELATKYKTISATLSPDSLMAAYAGSLTGGDPRRGRMIFFRNQAAQCTRCHSIDDYNGGNAGPRLNGVASRLKRSQLLEALINPSARIAQGYGTTVSSMPDMKYNLSKKQIRDVVSFLAELKDDN
jgi:HEAT repeat protein